MNDDGTYTPIFIGIVGVFLCGWLTLVIISFIRRWRNPSAYAEPSRGSVPGRRARQTLAFQSATNRMVQKNLIKYGDDLHTRRPVDHFLYFSVEATRQTVADELTKGGFQVRLIPRHAKSDPARPYGLCARRVDAVDNASIDGVVEVLLNAALGYGGEYDGWETVVIKPKVETPQEPAPPAAP